MELRAELEQEEDGRWIADVVALPGVMAYGNSREEALRHAMAFALRVVADQLDHGEVAPQAVSLIVAGS